ncbi:hypothetical protein BABINDRAFT_13028 [Babjeviella inositovora NRRL Y-12698]|uniref:Uncharacterized protein n=1 Tax=Babjeviella inositovora NRRL Y-12698 TaxID=984486 RepID=A0A1E3QR12_9ASCO|nr:uncharacterized protein BABINDRAFT_13028 [Babjeviella inositovora NRRL Y-12698]ODQ80129.1 hypothetical protein BABINDRAFT_13028 [Babjeviella inositovora NRRL Y-12698]
MAKHTYKKVDDKVDTSRLVKAITLTVLTLIAVVVAGKHLAWAISSAIYGDYNVLQITLYLFGGLAVDIYAWYFAIRVLNRKWLDEKIDVDHKNHWIWLGTSSLPVGVNGGRKRV